MSYSEEDYVKDRIEELKAQDRDRRHREEARRREREQEAKIEAYHSYRTAETWPEALRKQAHLFADEASQWTGKLVQEYPDDLFGPGAKACNRALEIWSEVEATKQEKIEELKRRLAAVQNEIRLEVATRLRSENDIQGWQFVADAIEDDEDLDSWLQW